MLSFAEGKGKKKIIAWQKKKIFFISLFPAHLFPLREGEEARRKRWKQLDDGWNAINLAFVADVHSVERREEKWEKKCFFKKDCQEKKNMHNIAYFCLHFFFQTFNLEHSLNWYQLLSTFFFQVGWKPS